MAKIIKNSAGEWYVEAGGNNACGEYVGPFATREQARAWVRNEKSCQAKAAAVSPDAIETVSDVVVNTTRPALPFAPSRYVGRTSLGLFAGSPFDVQTGYAYALGTPFAFYRESPPDAGDFSGHSDTCRGACCNA